MFAVNEGTRNPNRVKTRYAQLYFASWAESTWFHESYWMQHSK